jgi:hypothetical protein
MTKALKAPMNADPAPIAADEGGGNFAQPFAATRIRSLDSSAAIGAGSAFIGAFKDSLLSNSQ